MTNAERQRAYRARKGKAWRPTPIAKLVKLQGMSRTTYYYFRWLKDNHPSIWAECATGELKLATAYRIARAMASHQ